MKRRGKVLAKKKRSAQPRRSERYVNAEKRYARCEALIGEWARQPLNSARCAQLEVQLVGYGPGGKYAALDAVSGKLDQFTVFGVALNHGAKPRGRDSVVVVFESAAIEEPFMRVIPLLEFLRPVSRPNGYQGPEFLFMGSIDDAKPQPQTASNVNVN